MATKQQVKQALELTLSLSKSLGALTQEEAGEFFEVLGEINKVFSNPEAHVIKSTKAPKKHPVDTLLKKGKVEVSDGRYKQLIQIYDQIQIMGVKFIAAKQNSYATWFPLDFNGDKSAALYLSSSEWSIAPIKYRDDNDLTGEWEGFDLIEFMSMNCPEFEDDY